METKALQFGKIARLNKAGFGVLITQQDEEIPFSFSKIAKRHGNSYKAYGGQRLSELGVREGTKVRFSEAADGRVENIFIE